jgi:hypothetical protein
MLERAAAGADLDGCAMAINPQIGAEKRRALRLLASSPHGCTMSIMMAMAFR